MTRGGAGFACRTLFGLAASEDDVPQFRDLLLKIGDLSFKRLNMLLAVWARQEFGISHGLRRTLFVSRIKVTPLDPPLTTAEDDGKGGACFVWVFSYSRTLGPSAPCFLAFRSIL